MPPLRRAQVPRATSCNLFSGPWQHLRGYYGPPRPLRIASTSRLLLPSPPRALGSCVVSCVHVLFWMVGRHRGRPRIRGKGRPRVVRSLYSSAITVHQTDGIPRRLRSASHRAHKHGQKRFRNPTVTRTESSAPPDQSGQTVRRPGRCGCAALRGSARHRRAGVFAVGRSHGVRSRRG